MDLSRTTEALWRLGSRMKPDLEPVHTALEPLQDLLAAAGATYKLVGGLAVIHHGYERLTNDIDILITREAADRLDAYLECTVDQPCIYRLRLVAYAVGYPRLGGFGWASHNNPNP